MKTARQFFIAEINAGIASPFWSDRCVLAINKYVRERTKKMRKRHKKFADHLVAQKGKAKK